MIDLVRNIAINNTLKNLKSGKLNQTQKVGLLKSALLVFKMDNNEDISGLEDVLKAIPNEDYDFKIIAVVCNKHLFQENEKEGLIVPKSLINNNLTFISNDSLNWFGLPNLGTTKLIMGEAKKLDSIIFFNDTNNFALNYLAFKLSDNLIIGMEKNDIPYSMVFSKREGMMSYFEYFNQVISFFKIANNK